ncbi:hypothetical protein HY502_01890 [Candidatus Woesebacteria bacterium]|nr:hypothetical protein [Candidatus Woesebacteria bacterium]
MNYIPGTPLTSPILKKVIENSKKDEPTKALSIQIGFAFILTFLALAVFGPQIGDKLGTLSQKKQSQEARANIDGFLEQINNYRQQNGLAPLVEDQNVMHAACWKANDMAVNNYYSHTDSIGRDSVLRDSTRVPYVDVGNTWTAENLAASHLTGASVFDAWKNSSGHNATMLSSSYTRVGIGVAYNLNSQYRWYWATEFAGPAPDSSHPYVPLTNQECNLNVDPLGALDGPTGTINCETTSATGWAYDPNTPSQSTEVHIYVDGGVGSGAAGFPGIMANLPRSDINNLGIAGDRGFSWSIPSQYQSGTHSLYAYAINTQSGNNPLLGGSPRTYTCQAQQTAELTASPNPCLVPSTQGSCQTAVSWNTGGYSNVIVCLDSGTGEIKIGQGNSGSTTQFLAANRNHTLRLRTSSSNECSSGSIIKTTTVSVYKIDQNAGDVDCDGDIDSVDALHILRKVANLPINSSICNGAGFNLAKADVKDDNTIDAVDALFVLRIVTGLITLNPPSFFSNYVDTDYDLMTDAEEDSYSCLSKTTSDAVRNSDNDWLSFNSRRFGLTNIAEITLKSNPCALDTDGDGFGDVTEVYVGTKPDKRCGLDGWPADFISGGIPDSTNKITITDLTSFFSPIRHLDTSPQDPGYDVRWDLVPGKGLFAKDINIQDLTILSVLAPPMFNGQKAFNGPTCVP